MIDLHLHVMPGLDDGAEDMAAALDMARMAADSGVERAVAVVHGNLPGQDPEKLREAYRRKFDALRREIFRSGIALELEAGMEILASERMTELLEAETLLALGQSRYVLTEVGFRTKTGRIGRYLRQLQEAGWRPVLAHPERYEEVQKDPHVLREWRDEGIVLQVNKDSLLGYFGRAEKRVAHWMVQNHLAAVAASDGHDVYERTADMEELVEMLEFRYGYGCVELLLEENPARILEDRRVL